MSKTITTDHAFYTLLDANMLYLVFQTLKCAATGSIHFCMENTAVNQFYFLRFIYCHVAQFSQIVWGIQKRITMQQ